jgi:soluble lytic murein transglycosylase-like protein
MHIKDTITAQPCDPDLLLALVWQESLGRPWATRAEPAFWDHYLAGKPEWHRGLAGGSLACWRDRVSRSYGLLQLMPATAAWMGLAIDADPEVLFRPKTNLYYGAKFVRHLSRTHGDERSLALAWNGGGRPAYADEVLAKLAAVKGT